MATRANFARHFALTIVLTCPAIVACDDVVDYFVEGDCHPWYVVAGRYEGVWRLEGDPAELAEFAPGLARIEFRSADPAPGSWRGKSPPEGSAYLAKDEPTGGRGACVVDGREHGFRIQMASPHAFMDAWFQFEGRLPFLTERAYGDGFEVTLEAKRDPERDWLYLWFGRNPDGSATGFAFSRTE